MPSIGSVIREIGIHISEIWEREKYRYSVKPMPAFWELIQFTIGITRYVCSNNDKQMSAYKVYIGLVDILPLSLSTHPPHTHPTLVCFRFNLLLTLHLYYKRV